MVLNLKFRSFVRPETTLWAPCSVVLPRLSLLFAYSKEVANTARIQFWIPHNKEPVVGLVQVQQDSKNNSQPNCNRRGYEDRINSMWLLASCTCARLEQIPKTGHAVLTCTSNTHTLIHFATEDGCTCVRFSPSCSHTLLTYRNHKTRSQRVCSCLTRSTSTNTRFKCSASERAQNCWRARRRSLVLSCSCLRFVSGLAALLFCARWLHTFFLPLYSIPVGKEGGGGRRQYTSINTYPKYT